MTTLHRWMEQARKTGIHSLVRFVRTLKQDLSAVEAAVSERWSNGPVSSLPPLVERGDSVANFHLRMEARAFLGANFVPLAQSCYQVCKNFGCFFSNFIF